MIEFATLFLGLVFGTQQVEFLVHERVGAIEISLDYQVVGHLNQPPWQLSVDFGEDLAPHVLQAVAHGSSGTEIGRTEQWINTFTQQTDVSILVSPRQDGQGLQAQVAWETVTEQLEPESFRVELDGQPLEVEDPREFDLPRVDPNQAHFLRVELRFSDTLQASAEAVFGGPYSDQVNTELTAVPIFLDGRKKLPPLQDMQDWFLGAGRHLELRAIEEGPAEIVVVRDLATIGTFRDHDVTKKRSRRWDDWQAIPTANADALLKKDYTLRFVTPAARQIERQSYRYQIFPRSVLFSRHDGGLLWLFASIIPRAVDPQQQRLADAVAVAGMAAAQSGRRRIVLLILGPEPVDRSLLTPAAVLQFLRELRVPLVVWSPVRSAAVEGAWGLAVDISTRQRTFAANKRLSGQIERQRVVWLNGLHLPRLISLAPEAKGIRLVE